METLALKQKIDFTKQKMRTVWIFELLAKTEHVESPRKTSTFPIDQVENNETGRLPEWSSSLIYGIEHITSCHHIWVFPKIGVPQNGWFIMENPIKMDDLGIPLFLETPIYEK